MCAWQYQDHTNQFQFQPLYCVVVPGHLLLKSRKLDYTYILERTLESILPGSTKTIHQPVSVSSIVLCGRTRSSVAEEQKSDYTYILEHTLSQYYGIVL